MLNQRCTNVSATSKRRQMLYRRRCNVITSMLVWYTHMTLRWHVYDIVSMMWVQWRYKAPLLPWGWSSMERATTKLSFNFKSTNTSHVCMFLFCQLRAHRNEGAISLVCWTKKNTNMYRWYESHPRLPTENTNTVLLNLFLNASMGDNILQWEFRDFLPLYPIRGFSV